MFTRVPHLHLTLGKPSRPGSPIPRRATARWHHLEPADQPTRTCPQCTLHHTHGTTTQAWAYHPAHQRLCPRHYQWATPSSHRAPLNTCALPELSQAHHAHRRLTRRPDATTAYQWASSITTRWYDHQQHLTRRWHNRLPRLAATNPPPAGGKSWTLTARDAVTYPETVTLARHLSRTPRPQADPGFLGHTASTLGLDRLVLPPDDLLWTWIHTQQQPARHECQ
ncbi:hypothetical protein [Streptomyces sp. AC602_WCS936]|uniref:hypothetical protein n=1 Tax=Streptomyces sp. AC602_WCS936 TaxID=2823685 RepID=UPI001C25D9FF|nr:hypothetical protein [Streptomyces sp. AC602_WCS936]